MFRIGVFELGLTCLFAFLILAVPLIIASFSKKINKRLENIEKKIDDQEKK